MWPFNNKPLSGTIARRAWNIANNLGTELYDDKGDYLYKEYKDEKIRIKTRHDSSADIWVMMTDGEEHVFDYWYFIHTRVNVYRYGRWVNYLKSLQPKASEAWLQEHRKEKAQERHNFSDIDDSMIFGEEFAN